MNIMVFNLQPGVVRLAEHVITTPLFLMTPSCIFVAKSSAGTAKPTPTGESSDRVINDAWNSTPWLLAGTTPGRAKWALPKPLECWWPQDQTLDVLHLKSRLIHHKSTKYAGECGYLMNFGVPNFGGKCRLRCVGFVSRPLAKGHTDALIMKTYSSDPLKSVQLIVICCAISDPLGLWAWLSSTIAIPITCGISPAPFSFQLDFLCQATSASIFVSGRRNRCSYHQHSGHSGVCCLKLRIKTCRIVQASCNSRHRGVLVSFWQLPSTAYVKRVNKLPIVIQ